MHQTMSEQVEAEVDRWRRTGRGDGLSVSGPYHQRRGESHASTEDPLQLREGRPAAAALGWVFQHTHTHTHVRVNAPLHTPSVVSSERKRSESGRARKNKRKKATSKRANMDATKEGRTDGRTPEHGTERDSRSTARRHEVEPEQRVLDGHLRCERDRADHLLAAHGTPPV